MWKSDTSMSSVGLDLVRDWLVDVRASRKQWVCCMGTWCSGLGSQASSLSPSRSLCSRVPPTLQVVRALSCGIICFCFLRAYGGSQAGVEWELQLPAYTTATATGDQSCICDLHHSSQQCRILNPLSEARDRTHIVMDISQVCYLWAATGTPRMGFRIRQAWVYVLVISYSWLISAFPCLHLQKGSIAGLGEWKTCKVFGPCVSQGSEEKQNPQEA